MKTVPKADYSETVYIQKCLDCLKTSMPEVTPEQLRAFAVKTLFRMRLWEVIYQFRIKNYSIPNPLDVEYVND